MTDLVGKIMKYENDEMNEEETLEFFRELVESGLVWQLQGNYGRTAIALGFEPPK